MPACYILHVLFYNMQNVKYLYKYRAFDKNHGFDVLLKKEMYFTSPENFNDPFDSSIPIRWDLGSEADILQFYQGNIEAQYPGWDDIQIKAEAKRLFQTGLHKDPTILKNEFNKQKDRAFKNGVFSLSETYDNILMWSHYSSAHTGYCIGFDKSALENNYRLITSHEHKGIKLLKINYSKEFPPLHPYTDNPANVVLTVLTYKSIDWAYEKEWRLIYLNGANQMLKINTGVVKRIILGARTSEENKKSVIDILKKKQDNVVLFQAIVSTNRFGLEFKKIKY